MATGRAPVRRAVRTAHCKHMLIREGQTRSRSGDCGDSSGEVRYSLFSSRFRQRNATQRNSFPSHGREIQASLEGGERFTRLLEEHNTTRLHGHGALSFLAPFMGMGKEEGLFLRFCFLVFHFWKARAGLLRTACMHIFNFTKLAWTVFGGRRANEKSRAPCVSSFQKFARKKSKNVGFLSAFQSCFVVENLPAIQGERRKC